PDHRQPATLRGERVSCPRCFLFLGEERVPRHLPFCCGDDRGKIHRLLSIIWVLVMSARPSRGAPARPPWPPSYRLAQRQSSPVGRTSSSGAQATCPGYRAV